MAMTPRERVEAALKGRRPDRVPFTVYDTKLPRGRMERLLRNEGACLVWDSPPVFRTVSPHVDVTRTEYQEHGIGYVRTRVRTPVGEVTSVERVSPDGQYLATVAWPFKGPEDYRTLAFTIRDEVCLPNYEAFSRAEEVWGPDGFPLVNIGLPPLQHLMDVLMGLEAFSEEWTVRRDEVMALHDALAENRRTVYRVVAESPATAANYGANVSAEVVGLDRFERYFLPHYDEFAEVMHARGKVVGVHFDANTWLLSEAISRSKIDYVEALTPRPDCDMSVAEARVAWPDKALWVNFPTSVHREPDRVIEETMRQVLFEAAPGDRFILGVSESMPEDSWERSLSAILRVLREKGELPLR